MRITLMIAALTLGCARTAHAQELPAGPVVLITAFHPFAQRQKNGSATVAEALPRAVRDMQVHSEIMAVKWTGPDTLVPAWVAHWRPRLLLGLGEGAAGSVRVEHLARNQAEGLDVANQPPPFAWLQADGPRTRRSTLEFDPKWELSREIAIAGSDDAGSFLCNALFYVALAQPVERIGFIHLPPQGSEEDAAYTARLVPIIAQIARRNLGLPPAGP